MHTAPGAYNKHAPRAVYIQTMLLEHIWLRIFFNTIIVQDHMVLEHMISRGQNISKKLPSFKWIRAHQALPHEICTLSVIDLINSCMGTEGCEFPITS